MAHFAVKRTIELTKSLDRHQARLEPRKKKHRRKTGGAS